MGIGVIVHGFIETPGYGGQPTARRVFRHNRKVLRSLPFSDVDWPFFTRSMFSCLPLRNSSELLIPQYDGLVITFGATYKNMYHLEADWIAKYESLLGQLIWDRTSVFVDFSALRYDWIADREQFRIGYSSDPPKPPSNWSLTCVRLNKEQVPVSEVIDGNYKPWYRRS